MFLHLSVILFTGGGGGVHPLGRHSPWADTPFKTATAADGTHPTGMLSCTIMCKLYQYLEPILVRKTVALTVRVNRP